MPYFSPHVFGRHKFATRFLEAGYSLQFVKNAGHWKTIRLVAELYGHLEKREELNWLSPCKNCNSHLGKGEAESSNLSGSTMRR